MAVAYCLGGGDLDIVAFIRSKPRIKLQKGDDLNQVLKRLREADDDIVFDGSYINCPKIEGVTMNNASVYDLFVRLQAIGDAKHDATLFIWGINYPRKPQKDSHPLNKIFCAPQIPEGASDETENLAYHLARERFRSEFMNR